MLQQLRRDTEFLSRSGVAEYRLLLWVHGSEHPLRTTEKLEAQLRRRCWDQSRNDWCRFRGGFLSLVGNHSLVLLSFVFLERAVCWCALSIQSAWTQSVVVQNNDGTFRVSFLTLWDIFSARKNDDRRRSSGTRYCVRVRGMMGGVSGPKIWR